ncbi:MAG: TetR/AcrR family transcriptional regulator [Pseudonocardiales bacterium]|nr:TetR/AcrR family transcriptional regulator [Pseudonocardiales bacterium]
MPTKTAGRPSEKTSARDRLLAAATELFYAEGIHTVGIDRVIERAGVAKATLYSTFGSKDELIRTYLAGRHDVRRQRMDEGLSRFEDPRDRLLGVFDVLGELFAEPTYRGCAFANASAEAQLGSPILAEAERYRAWVRTLFVDLAVAAGAAEPETLAGQLVLLYDGAGVGARMDRNPQAAASARAIAATLVDAAIPARISAAKGAR